MPRGVQGTDHEAVDHFADQKETVCRECWLICDGSVQAKLGLGAGRGAVVAGAKGGSLQ